MFKENFISNLKQSRKACGLTQDQAAKELEISRSTLANYETGSREPELEILCKIIKLYKVDANWLLGIK